MIKESPTAHTKPTKYKPYANGVGEQVNYVDHKGKSTEIHALQPEQLYYNRNEINQNERATAKPQMKNKLDLSPSLESQYARGLAIGSEKVPGMNQKDIYGNTLTKWND